MKKTPFNAFSYIWYFLEVGSQIDSDPGGSRNTSRANFSDG